MWLLLFTMFYAQKIDEALFLSLTTMSAWKYWAINFRAFLIKTNFYLQAAQGAVRLEGDVITANGSILSIPIVIETNSLDEPNSQSVCTCNCCGEIFRGSNYSPESSVYMPPSPPPPAIPLRPMSRGPYPVGTRRRASIWHISSTKHFSPRL